MSSSHKSSRAGDLIFEISRLGRRAGAMFTESVDVPAPGDLGISMIGVPEGSPMALDLKIESVVEGVWVSGTVAVSLAGQCSRCLTDMSMDDVYDIAELYYWPGKEAEDDAKYVAEDRIDLEPALREAIVLDLPFAPVCKPDCLGLCPECGANLNDNPDHVHESAVDARWGQLEALLNPTGVEGNPESLRQDNEHKE